MKRISVLLSMMAICLVSYSQNRVKASEIIKQINSSKNVSYSNVEIEGELDLTDLDNREVKRSSSNWFGSDNDVFESHVEVSLSFVNCTFLDNVLAYYHVDYKNDTYIAQFESDVIFKNCVFKRASEFKYSEFPEKVDFSGSTFNRDANFKYAEFSEGPNFAGAKFEDEANFKYAEFPRNTSFEKASFYGLANFKYSKFRTPLNMDNVAFRGSEDFKYTKVDGRNFTSYLLDKR